jgi:two-component system, NarL family, response regulator LiaR
VVAGEDAGHREPGRRTPAAGRPTFSASQAEILRWIVEGFSNAEIAAQVHLSENTVKTHVREILRRAGARNRVEVAVRAVREGWVS